MTVQKFEDFEIWKKSRRLCKSIKDLSSSSTLVNDFSLRNQILRSSGSVMDNVGEGYERDEKKEFLQFLYIAKGSLGETRSQIYRCFDSHHFTEEQYNSLLQECFNLSGQIKQLLNYLHRSEYEGNKKRKTDA